MTDRDDARRQALFAELAETGSMTARNELVEDYAPLAEFFANRYRTRTPDHDDVRQVAQLALVKAVNRYDPDVGVKFSTFAGKTIDGELKRYFRDRTWAVRVPRSLQETALEIRDLADRLTIQRGRFPTVKELAEQAGYDTALVVQALDVQTSQRATSIDQLAGDQAASERLASSLGMIDENFARTDVKISMRALLDVLDERQRRIIELRFYDELTQQQIADRIGISQMHVSRLLRDALETLRAEHGRP